MKIGNCLLSSLVLFVACGCGGGSDNSAPNARSTDLFLGEWTGNYGVAGQPSEGTMTVTIRRNRGSDSSVTISGNAVDVERGEIAVQGSIPDVEGTALPIASLTLPFVPDNARWFFGHAQIDSRGHLIVEHIESSAGIINPPEDVDLTPVAG